VLRVRLQDEALEGERLGRSRETACATSSRCSDEEQRPWEELVEKYSDFYQPRRPVSERGQMDPSLMPLKGRFRNYQRNNFLAEVGESEYGLFLTGGSITDFVFFEQEVGTLGAPMRGPVGWYMPRPDPAHEAARTHPDGRRNRWTRWSSTTT
jgi:hypothetical protein